MLNRVVHTVTTVPEKKKQFRNTIQVAGSTECQASDELHNTHTQPLQRKQSLNNNAKVPVEHS
jgi:hypothetical protein